MAMHGPTLTIALVTTHCSLKEATHQLSTDELVRVSKLLHSSLSQRLGREPRIAVLGLNPHAGEGGLFGSEEREVIVPAIASLQNQSISVAGPLAADSAFTLMVRQNYDGFVCCYHDQGADPL